MLSLSGLYLNASAQKEQKRRKDGNRILHVSCAHVLLLSHKKQANLATGDPPSPNKKGSENSTANQIDDLRSHQLCESLWEALLTCGFRFARVNDMPFQA